MKRQHSKGKWTTSLVRLACAVLVLLYISSYLWNALVPDSKEIERIPEAVLYIALVLLSGDLLVSSVTSIGFSKDKGIQLELKSKQDDSDVD